MPFIHNVTLPSKSEYNLEGTLYTIKGTQASSTASWTGTCDLIALKDKVTIGYIMPYDTVDGSTPTLNLTLKDNTTTGAKTVVGADHAKAKDVLVLTYVLADDKWYAIGSFAYEIVTSISSSSTDNQVPTAAAVYDAINTLPKPMVFKGTVGDAAQSPTITWANLPAASSSNTGYTYKVVTAHATTPVCIIGDLITSNGTEWIVIPSGDDPGGTDTWRNILVNGVEKLGSGIDTGALDFVNGTRTSLTFTPKSGSTPATLAVNATDTRVEQANYTANNDYQVLFASTTTRGTVNEGVGKDISSFMFNPSTDTLTVADSASTPTSGAIITKDLTVTNINGVAVGATPAFTDTTYTAATGTVKEVDTFTANTPTNFEVANEVLKITGGSAASLSTNNATVVTSVTAN